MVFGRPGTAVLNEQSSVVALDAAFDGSGQTLATEAILVSGWFKGHVRKLFAPTGKSTVASSESSGGAARKLTPAV